MSTDTNASMPSKRRRRWRGILRPDKRCSRAASERVLSLVRHGHALREIAARNGMPTVDTLCRWIGENKDFAKRYRAARRARDQMLADEAALLKAREMRLRVAMLERRIPRARTTDAELESEASSETDAREEVIAAHLRAVLDGKFDSPPHDDQTTPPGAGPDV
ncbi:MAG TPA: hypothetical protein VFO61_03350 [Alphaproteobacteria bacterium]|nr:hypothetical protein [Alphaproteobacteria bacterium]